MGTGYKHSQGTVRETTIFVPFIVDPLKHTYKP